MEERLHGKTHSLPRRLSAGQSTGNSYWPQYKGFWPGLLLHDNQRTGGTMVQKISHKDCFHLRCAAELVFKDKRVQRDDG